MNFYSSISGNRVVFGDFSLETQQLVMVFLFAINFIKNKTCFQGKGSRNDLKSQKEGFFQNVSSTETGLTHYSPVLSFYTP